MVQQMINLAAQNRPAAVSLEALPDSDLEHLTDEQILSICNLHDWHQVKQPLCEFLLSAQPQLGFNDRSVMVNTGLMWVGIEADGSRHS